MGIENWLDGLAGIENKLDPKIKLICEEIFDMFYKLEICDYSKIFDFHQQAEKLLKD